MRITFYGDIHMDIPNMDLTEYAMKAVDGHIQAEMPDVAVNLGDLVVSRGAIHPHVSSALRRHFVNQSQWTKQRRLLVLKGNHDDTYHADRADSIQGIASDVPGIQLYSEPNLEMIGDGERPVALVMVPSPSKHAYAAFVANGGVGDPRDHFVNLVRGLIAKARDFRRGEHGHGPNIIVCYHGTVDGCTLDNEQGMPAGQDYSLPHDAFRGADLVVCGHIHKPQKWPAGPNHPAGYYVGSISPLTWGEKHEPRMLVVDVEDGELKVRSLKIPVLHQMIQKTVALAEGDDVTQEARGLVELVLEDVPEASRVRLIVKGHRAALAQLDAHWEKRTALRHRLAEFKCVREPVDAGLARLGELDRQWTILDVFERWLKFKGLDEDEAEWLMDMADSVEHEVRDTHLDASYDFRPTRLTGTNWCQYPDLEIDFDTVAGVVAVVGNNAAGKSNLARAIPFALYKKQLSGRSLAKLVRNGEKACELTLDFDSAGVGYRINRTIKVNNKGVASSELEFMRREVSGTAVSWVPVNEGTSRETQVAIEQLVGPWEMFQWTSWAGQNDVDALLALTPAEMKDVLVGLMQRNWEARQAAGKEQCRRFEEQLEQAEAAAAAVREHRGDLDEVMALVKAATAEGVLLKAELEALEEPPFDALAEARAKRDAAQEAMAGYTEARDKLSSLTRRHAELTGQVMSLAAEMQRLDKQLLAPEVISQKAERMREREAEVERQAAIANRIRADLTAHEGGMLVLEQEHQTGRAAVMRRKSEELPEALEKAQVTEEAYRKAKDELDRLLREEQKAEQKLERARADAELIGDVPCEGGRWFTDCGEDTDMSGCKFLVNATIAQACIPDLEKTHADLHGQVEVLSGRETELNLEARHQRSEYEALVTRLDRELEAVDREFHEKVAAARLGRDRLQGCLLAAESDRDKASSVAEDVAAELQAQAGLRERRAAAAERHAALNGDLAAVSGDLARANQDVQAAESAKSRFEALTAGVASLEQRVVAAGAARDEKAAALAAVNESLARLGGRSEQIVEQIKKVEDVAAGRTLAEAMVRRWKFYVESMDRDGLPFMLLEQFAIPALRNRVNEYLERTEFRVTVQSERTTQAGDLRNEVVVEFEDARGRHDLSAASGQQSTSIGMALRAALADLHADATGSKIHFTAQDEGFGTMDPANLDGAKATVAQIAQRRGWYFIISHVGGMDESSDSVISVTNHGEFSSATVRK